MGKAARDQSARDRVKAQREEQRQKERMRRMVTIVAAVVVALAAIGARRVGRGQGQRVRAGHHGDRADHR